DSVILTTSSLELWMLSEASRLLLKLKSTDEYCYILFSAFNKFAEEPIIFGRFSEFKKKKSSEHNYLSEPTFRSLLRMTLLSFKIMVQKH
ncbi:MAG: hypothetical protein MR983_10180, partial [Succinatimonas sp.]|nr:hypothetical protein [Succinatimonas sp.]